MAGLLPTARRAPQVPLLHAVYLPTLLGFTAGFSASITWFGSGGAAGVSFAGGGGGVVNRLSLLANANSADLSHRALVSVVSADVAQRGRR